MFKEGLRCWCSSNGMMGACESGPTILEKVKKTLHYNGFTLHWTNNSGVLKAKETWCVTQQCVCVKTPKHIFKAYLLSALPFHTDAGSVLLLPPLPAQRQNNSVCMFYTEQQGGIMPNIPTLNRYCQRGYVYERLQCQTDVLIYSECFIY